MCSTLQQEPGRATPTTTNKQNPSYKLKAAAVKFYNTLNPQEQRAATGNACIKLNFNIPEEKQCNTAGNLTFMS